MAKILTIGTQRRDVKALVKAIGLMRLQPVTAYSREQILDRVASWQPDLILMDEHGDQPHLNAWHSL